MPRTSTPTDPNAAASKSQTRAIFFSCGLDARPLSLTYKQASDILDILADPEKAEAEIEFLQSLGATGTPKLPKSVRDAKHAALFAKAWAAGVAAVEGCVPTPMTVVEHANPVAGLLGGDPGPIVKEYEPVADGVCGFAWVTITPGNSSFARWLIKEGKARPHYRGGIQVWISGYRQSYERKSAHAQGMAEALREAGIKAYSGGRLD